MKVRRKMVKIDEERCNGCGLCVPSCAEGALQIIDGKARLVSDVYCDGLGACLGECPMDAISIEEREAEEFDEAAVAKRLNEQNEKNSQKPTDNPTEKPTDLPCGCPGMAVKKIARQTTGDDNCCSETASAPLQSQLTNWPVQIKLVPPQAPYLQGAKLLIAADCVPCAYADFHQRFVKDRVVLLGCPKLDDGDFYIDKLATMFSQNDIQHIALPYMEVPCCHGLVHIVEAALKKAGKDIPVTMTMIAIDGSVKETRER